MTDTSNPYGAPFWGATLTVARYMGTCHIMVRGVPACGAPYFANSGMLSPRDVAEGKARKGWARLCAICLKHEAEFLSKES